MPVTFSTDSVSARDQVEYWREAICDVFMHLEVDAPHAGAQGFEGRIVQHSQGRLNFSEVLVESHAVLRTPRELHRSSDDSFFVMVQREGESWLEQDGRSGWLRAGEFALLDNSRPYAMRFPQPIHHQILKLSRSALQASIREPERFTSLAMPGGSGVGRVFLGVLGTLRDAAGDLADGAAAGVSDALVDLLGASVASVSTAQVKAPSNLERYHRERVRGVVRERLFDPELSVESVAATVQLSTRYLQRLFEDEPMTLSAWIWHERTEAAHRMLLSPANRKLSFTEIAYTVGFKDPAHFSRVFKATYGASPRAFRREMANPSA